jgi:ABC-type branched-subunit amino acid transport system substrate-binding protein
VTRTLKARQAVLVDDQVPDSVPLAASIEARLRAAGIAVTRKSVVPETTDFAPLIGELEPGIGVLVLAWQNPATATLFGRQLRSAGFRVPIFGTDTLDSLDFKVNGSYVTAFVPNVNAIEENSDLLARYRARFGAFITKFGPPVYVAAQAAANAIRNACRDGEATRAEVVGWVRRTFIPRSLLGTRIQFTARGDVRDAKYSIFKRESGVWKMVG